MDEPAMQSDADKSAVQGDGSRQVICQSSALTRLQTLSTVKPY